MKNINPLCTVVMATYNNTERELKSSISSIINQSYRNFKFIILDDGSDNFEVLLKMVLDVNDDRILLIKNDINTGLGSSLNQLISLTESQFVVRMDADDLSSKDRLKILIDYMTENPKVDICSSWGFTFGVTFKPLIYPTRSNEIRANVFLKSPLLHAGCIYRMATFRKKRIKYENIPGEDYELWIRLSRDREIVFSAIPRFLYFYRIKPPQVQGKKMAIHRQLMKQCIVDSSLNLNEQDIEGFIDFNTKKNSSLNDVKHYISTVTAIVNQLQKDFNMEKEFLINLYFQRMLYLLYKRNILGDNFRIKDNLNCIEEYQSRIGYHSKISIRVTSLILLSISSLINKLHSGG
jgi:glycosyltransferase involved in cell wall biosynthesis